MSATTSSMAPALNLGDRIRTHLRAKPRQTFEDLTAALKAPEIQVRGALARLVAANMVVEDPHPTGVPRLKVYSTIAAPVNGAPSASILDEVDEEDEPDAREDAAPDPAPPQTTGAEASAAPDKRPPRRCGCGPMGRHRSTCALAGAAPGSKTFNTRPAAAGRPARRARRDALAVAEAALAQGDVLQTLFAHSRDIQADLQELDALRADLVAELTEVNAAARAIVEGDDEDHVDDEDEEEEA